MASSTKNGNGYRQSYYISILHLHFKSADFCSDELLILPIQVMKFLLLNKIIKFSLICFLSQTVKTGMSEKP